jgi:sarcosine oxidase subunit gamma
MAALETSVRPDALPRRSFVYRVLQAAGAEFAALGDAAVAIGFGRTVEAEIEQARVLGLADLSPLPRTGFKGAGAVEWLVGQGVEIGPDSNRAYAQPGGELAARLAPTEVLLLDGLAGTGALVGRLDKAWAWGTETPRKPIGYPVPRADSHAWFAVTGRHAPAMFAKLCGVDLQPSSSPRRDRADLDRQDERHRHPPRPGRRSAFHLLADSASAAYLWGCVADAMAEFAGAPVGLAALRRLAGDG